MRQRRTLYTMQHTPVPRPHPPHHTHHHHHPPQINKNKTTQNSNQAVTCVCVCRGLGEGGLNGNRPNRNKPIGNRSVRIAPTENGRNGNGSSENMPDENTPKRELPRERPCIHCQCCLTVISSPEITRDLSHGTGSQCPWPAASSWPRWTESPRSETRTQHDPMIWNPYATWSHDMKHVHNKIHRSETRTQQDPKIWNTYATKWRRKKLVIIFIFQLDWSLLCNAVLCSRAQCLGALFAYVILNEWLKTLFLFKAFFDYSHSHCDSKTTTKRDSFLFLVNKATKNCLAERKEERERHTHTQTDRQTDR